MEISKVAIFVPRLGQLLTLVRDWTFEVIPEDRNESLYRLTGRYYRSYWDRKPGQAELVSARGQFEGSNRSESSGDGVWTYRTFMPCYGPDCPDPEPFTFTIPKGTVLKVERLFVRRSGTLTGGQEFDSITFSARLDGNRVRFFVKLAECQGVEVNIER